MSWRQIIGLATVGGLAFSGCTLEQRDFTWELPKIEAPKGQREVSLVGVGVSDITPPPLHGMSGYSRNGFESEGVRLKLKARAFYLGFREGPPLLLIQLDLLSGSLLLHRAVADRVSKYIGVDPAGILLAGTHTHGGPGNFFASNFYNNWAGTEAGLDEPVFDFLVEQISHAAVEGYDTRKPGTITTATTEIKGLNRNRSMAAFSNNPHHKDADGPLDATNTKLSVIRLDALQGDQLKPLAALASFSVHGTSVPPTDVYNGDLFSYAAEAASSALSEDLHAKVVVGIINRTHGDNSPHYTHQGFEEAERLGQALGGSTADLFRHMTPDLKDVTKSKLAAEDFDLLAASQGENPTLCSPKVGMALAGGAEDGPTPVLYHLPWFGEGWPQKESYYTCQGEKRVLASFFQPWFVPEAAFPRHAMVQVLTINDLALVALPFEITLEMGRHLEEPLARIGFAPDQVAVVSCSNGYFGYLTTREEYAMQHYEGGHTLYGPGSGSYFVNAVANLAQDLKANDQVSRLSDLKFSLSVRSGQPLAREPWPHPIAWISEPEVRTDSGVPHLAARWQGGLPDQIGFQFPLLVLEQEKSPGEWQILRTEESGELETRYIKQTRDQAVFEARWYFHDQSALNLPVRFRWGGNNLQPLARSGIFKTNLSQKMSH